MASISSISQGNPQTIDVVKVQPKINQRITEVLKESLAKGVAFPRKHFTSADRAYLYLTGTYYYDQGDNKTPEFYTQRSEFYEAGTFRTPEFLAYRFFNQVRDIYKGKPSASIAAAKQTLDELCDAAPKDYYPILYWAYREAKNANAQELVEFLLKEIDYEKNCEYRKEFQSTSEMVALDSAVNQVFAQFPAEMREEFASHSQPRGLITGILESIWENRFEELNERFATLGRHHPVYMKEVARAALRMIDLRIERISKKEEALLNEKLSDSSSVDDIAIQKKKSNRDCPLKRAGAVFKMAAILFVAYLTQVQNIQSNEN